VTHARTARNESLPLVSLLATARPSRIVSALQAGERMTPLSDALTAAQRSALAALEKAYVAGQIEPEQFAERLAAAGITDTLDLAFLLHALDVLKEWGVAAPNMTERITEAKVEPATEKQKALLAELAHKKGYVLSDYPFTKAEASRAIDEMQKGNYDPKKWADVPF